MAERTGPRQEKSFNASEQQMHRPACASVHFDRRLCYSMSEKVIQSTKLHGTSYYLSKSL